MNAAAADSAATVLAARTSPEAAALVVVLRGGHWPYSCALACAVRDLAPRLSAAGAEVLLLASESAPRRQAIAGAWRLPFRWLPRTEVEPVARGLGAWDRPSGRALDALGLLHPDGIWLLRQSYDDPGTATPPDTFLTALRRASLPPAPLPRAEPPTYDDATVVTTEQAARTLHTALAAAEHLARRLPGAPAADKADRIRRHFALLLSAVRDDRLHGPRAAHPSS
jgi:hypothetical protein